MSFFILTILAAALGYAAFDSAGVTPDWNWSLCAVGVAAALHFTASRRGPIPRLERFAAALLAGFVGLAALQLLPVPVRLVAALSPARAGIHAATAPVLGPLPAWTTLSIVPRESTQYLLTLAALALVFVVIRELTLEREGRSFAWLTVWPLLIIASAEGLLGFIQAYAEGGDGHARGTYVSYDHYAGLLEVVLPFAVLYPIAILQRDRHRHESPAGPALKACAIFALAAVILIGIIHSLSRMAFLASLASLFVAASLAIILRNSQIDQPVKDSILRRWLPVALVAVIVVLGFIFLPTDPLIARFSDLAKTEDISADTRAQIWRDSTALVKAFPVFGCGFGGYESAFYRFKTVAPMFTVDYAHNDYLQVLIESGILGFGIGLLLLSRVVFSAFRGAIYARSADERLLAIACLASLTAILLHSFVDFNMYVPANAFAVAWIGGIASTHIARRQRQN